MTYKFITRYSFERQVAADHHQHDPAQRPHINGLRKVKAKIISEDLNVEEKHYTV